MQYGFEISEVCFASIDPNKSLFCVCVCVCLYVCVNIHEMTRVGKNESDRGGMYGE